MIDQLKKELTATWNEKKPISIKIEYTGQKSFTVESMSIEYEDSNGKKNWIEYPVKSDACTRTVTQIYYLPQISGNHIVDGKLIIGFTDFSNQKIIGEVQIKNGDYS
jgi:predicted lipoprotein